jgi:hypothetical protein
LDIEVHPDILVVKDTSFCDVAADCLIDNQQYLYVNPKITLQFRNTSHTLREAIQSKIVDSFRTDVTYSNVAYKEKYRTSQYPNRVFKTLPDLVNI